MRSATALLSWLFFCVAAAPASAQSPSASQEALPVGEQAAVEGRATPPAALLPLHVQPVTREKAPVGVTPLLPEPPRRKATPPPASFEETGVPSKVEASETVPQPLQAAGGGPVGFPDRYAAATGTTLSIPAEAGVLANDLDPDGEALTVTILNETQTSGDVTLFADGRFTYTPPEGFAGTDTFEYKMRDASFNQTDYVTVSIDVYEGNRPPTGLADRYATLAGTPLSVSAAAGVLANDLDLDGEALTVTILNESQTSGDVTLFADGRFTYTPAEDFTGTDTFEYKLRDASFNSSDYVTVTIEVYEGNQPPRGLPDAYVVDSGNTLTVSAEAGVLSNDFDAEEEALSVSSTNTKTTQGSVKLSKDGAFAYTPPATFTGPDTFQYKVQDASGHESDFITVSLLVVASGKTPIGAPDTYATAMDDVLSISAEAGVLKNDIGFNGETLTITILDESSTSGDVMLFSDGRFTYTPPEGFVGTDTFRYKMRDASLNNSDYVTVTIEVLETNRTPVGTSDAYTMLSSTTLSIPAEAGVLANDLDPDGEALTVTILNETQTSGDVTLFSDGRFTYTPPEGFSGTDTFQYRMRDASFNQTDYVTVTIEVYEGNRSPLGTDDVYAILMDTPLSVSAEAGVLANDLDLDGEALTVTILNESQTSGDVTLFSDGRFTYTPPEGFAGTDTFEYKMRDASFNQTDYVTVAIEVLDPQAPPLPVELVSFEAQVDDEAVVLRWTTLTETNNAGFDVEQRTDSTWTRIGFVDGFGTTVESREYVHRIESVTPGRYAFRLKQIDFDGAFDYSPEVEIHIQPTAFRLSANYPNPFNPSTTIAFEVPEAVPVRVVVYDLLGRTVATLVDEVVEAGRHDVVWNARDAAGQPVASGLYLYRMEADAFSQTHRMTLIK